MSLAVGDVAAVRGLVANTSNRFRLLVLAMAERLQTNADWVLAVMASETGGTFSPSIRNPQGGATGLLQFMPATAKALGTTTDELAAMSAEDQLEYVELYLQTFTGKLNSPEDVYMAVFMPVHVGKSAGNIVAVEGAEGFSGKVYAVNKGFDRNKDGVITNGEVGSVVRATLEKAAPLPRVVVHAEESDDGARAAGLLALFGGGFLLWKALRS